MNEFSIKNGLTTYQLKIIGIVCMTIDHVGKILQSESGLTETHLLTTIGRIAAPIFLFVATIGFRKTSNKLTYMLRLYCANVIIQITTLLLQYTFNDIFYNVPSLDILITFFYTVLIISLIENIKNKRVIPIISIISTILIPILALVFIPQYEMIISIFLPCIITVSYSPLFIVMGVLLYYFNSKNSRIFIVTIFSLLALVGSIIINYLDTFIFIDFFSYSQFFMILSIPFIYLYNGEKGIGRKYLFYIYYPIHAYVLCILVWMGHLVL